MEQLPVLDPTEQRVLGALLEKEVTVPASYPMTLNSLRQACNQASSRDPVVEYDEALVTETLRSLKDKQLAGVTWEDRGRRTMKWVQRLAARLDLEADERALLTVLLLRGPQPAGALKTRTERLHGFEDREAAGACLERMATRQPALVRQLPRGPREQDPRWVHLLGPSDLEAAPATLAAPAAAATRESVIAEGGAGRDDRVRSSYSAVAADYAAALTDELSGLAFERWLLDEVAAGAEGGPVVEVGCGPGHVTAYLAAAGAQASGIDLTPAMVEQSRERFPEGDYEVGDLRQLMRPRTADGWSAVLAWYSLIHLSPTELVEAVSALARPLTAGGVLLVALHSGEEVLHPDSWFDNPIELDFVLHTRPEVVDALVAAGLTEVEWWLRGPHAPRGETTERLYVLARKP